MSRDDISNGNWRSDEPTNDATERTLLGRRDWLKLGGTAVGASLLGTGYGATGPAAATSTQNDDYLNLASEVPQQAMDLWDRQPDDYRAEFPTQDVTSYAGRSGDLAEAIQNASSNGRIADLGSNNEYELESMATAPGSHFGVIGDNCRIYFNRNDTYWMMQPNCEVAVIKGVTFDISESSESSSAVLGGNFSEEFWAEDVTLAGERNSNIDNGRNNTWRPHMTSEDAEGFVENLTMADGDYYSGSGSPPGGTRSMAVSADPGHQGYIAYKDCYAEGWTGNGFYMAMDPHQNPGGWGSGGTLLWNCTAINNHRGNMRVGLNDKIVGGYVDVSDMPGDLQGQGVVCCYATGDANNPTEIIGVRTGGNDYQREAIVCRRFYYNRGDTAHVRFKKVVLDAEGKQPPVSIRPGSDPDYEIPDGVEAEFEDVYLSDEYPDSRYGGMFEIRNDADVYAEEFRARSESNHEIEVQSGGTFTYGGTTYNGGDYTASELGLPDPRDEYNGLPEFYFDYGDGGGGGGGGGSDWLDLGGDDDQSSVTNEGGVLFWLKEDLGAIEARISQNTEGHRTAYLRDADANVVTQTDISGLSAGDTFTLAPSGGIAGSDSYSVTLDANGDHWGRGEDSNPTYAYEDDTFQVTYGVYSSGHSVTENVRYGVSEIVGHKEPPGWLDLGSDDDQSSVTNEGGVLFWLKEDVDAIEARISQNTAGHQTAYLRDTDANVVTQTDISGLDAGDTFTLSPAGGIAGSSSYSVTIDANGAHWNRGEDSNPTYAYEDDTFQVTYGVYSSGHSVTENVRYGVSEIRDV